jgi:hypothetical protein
MFFRLPQGVRRPVESEKTSYFSKKENTQQTKSEILVSENGRTDFLSFKNHAV